MNLDMKTGLVHVYNKNNYHFDQDSGLSLQFQVTGCKQIRLLAENKRTICRKLFCFCLPFTLFLMKVLVVGGGGGGHAHSSQRKSLPPGSK